MQTLADPAGARSPALPHAVDPAILLTAFTGLCLAPGKGGHPSPGDQPTLACLRVFSSCGASVRFLTRCDGKLRDLSKRKRRLDSLEAAQGAPRDPRRDSRGERTQKDGRPLTKMGSRGYAVAWGGRT